MKTILEFSSVMSSGRYCYFEPDDQVGRNT